jgi:hypothetical protein
MKVGRIGNKILKQIKMKKILMVLMLAVTLVSCYSNYIEDWNFDGVYFPYQYNVRTFVVGEGMKIEVGVDLAGDRVNTKDRVVVYTRSNGLLVAGLKSMKATAAEQYIKDAVVPVTTLLPLPTKYYSLSDTSKIVIKAGNHMGSVTVTVDSTLFLADPLTLFANYAIPFQLLSADADTILPAKSTAVIGLKYENMLYGNYWHGGVTTVKDATGATIQTIAYYSSVNQPETKIWKLKTVAPNALVSNGYSDQTTTKSEMKLTLDGSNIVVSTNTGSTFAVLPDGASTFNRAKLLQNRKIFLNYKYINAAGNTCYAQDTLTFRNRVHDGVNEWQDENPANYK